MKTSIIVLMIISTFCLTSCSKKKTSFHKNVIPLIKQSNLNETISYQADFATHKLPYSTYEKEFISACQTFNGLIDMSNEKQEKISDAECVDFMIDYDPEIEKLKNK